MQQFTFILKDNTQKAFNSFFWFLLFLHVIAASVITINTQNELQKIYALIILFLLILLTIAYYLPPFSIKWFSYQASMLVVMVFFWPLQSAWLLTIVVLAVIAFALVVLKTKSTALFAAENILINKSLFKKSYAWAEVENVVLKDHLLSIDFKNNHLIQIEITPESFNIDETTFNQFCLNQLQTLNPKP
jgi:hypothetical protein